MIRAIRTTGLAVLGISAMLGTAAAQQMIGADDLPSPYAGQEQRIDELGPEGVAGTRNVIENLGERPAAPDVTMQDFIDAHPLDTMLGHLERGRQVQRDSHARDE